MNTITEPVLWLHASTMIPPGPSGYMYSVVSSESLKRPEVVGSSVTYLLQQYKDEYPEVDLTTLVLTIEPDGVHHRLTVQTALKVQ